MVVEAMKMQNEVKSPKKGTVQKIVVREGAAVNAGDESAVVHESADVDGRSGRPARQRADSDS